MLPRLYPILDASFLPAHGPAREATLQSLVEELRAVGVTVLQYRNKVSTEGEILADVNLLRRIVPTGTCPLILTDDPSLAVQAKFDGVHVGQQDMALEEAREIV